MTISWIQAILLGLFACLSSVTGAGGTTLGNYTLGRPLVGGLVCGIILGDISTGVLVGCAIQVVFIALTTPGCIATADVRAICYIGIPYSMMAIYAYGLNPMGAQAAGLASVMGAFIGTIGVVLCNKTIEMNRLWVKKGWEAIEAHDYRAAYKVDMIYPWIAHFFLSFLPTLILCRFGNTIVAGMVSILPLNNVIMKSVLIGGMMIPCVGIANVLQMMVQKPLEFIPYFFGFTLAASLGINLFPCAVIAAMFAIVHYQINIQKLKIEENSLNISNLNDDDGFEEGI